MGMDGDPRRAGHKSRGMIHRAADPASAASDVARPPMSHDEPDRWLRAPCQRKPAADGIAMLDGFVAAIVDGPSHLRAARLALPAARRDQERHQRWRYRGIRRARRRGPASQRAGRTTERGAGALRANLRTRCPRRHRRRPVVSRLPSRHPTQSKILAKVVARPRPGASVADPDPGALHQRRRPASPRRAAARPSHRIGAVRRPPHDPRRCRCHPEFWALFRYNLFTPDRACHVRVISPHAGRVATVLYQQRLPTSSLTPPHRGDRPDPVIPPGTEELAHSASARPMIGPTRSPHDRKAPNGGIWPATSQWTSLGARRPGCDTRAPAAPGCSGTKCLHRDACCPLQFVSGSAMVRGQTWLRSLWRAEVVASSDAVGPHSLKRDVWPSWCTNAAGCPAPGTVETAKSNLGAYTIKQLGPEVSGGSICVADVEGQGATFRGQQRKMYTWYDLTNFTMSSSDQENARALLRCCSFRTEE